MSIELDHSPSSLVQVSTNERREALKAEMKETCRKITAMKLALGIRHDVQMVRDMKELKRQQRKIQIDLHNIKGVIGRTEMTFGAAFVAVAGRLLPHAVFRELRLAVNDYRELEYDADVEEMLMERLRYVEEAIRGVKY